MKIILILILTIAVSMPVAAQQKLQAPFGGKLIDGDNILVFKRGDGSELMSINDSGWFLSKESNGNNPLPIPVYVNSRKLMPVVYVTSDATKLRTLDGVNWSIYSSPEKILSVENEKDRDILKVTKLPENPVESEFVINFNLYSPQNVELAITDVQGKTLLTRNKMMNKGKNSFSIDISSLTRGGYIYKITAGTAFYRGKFIKM